jgi:MinD-like ATPase involved in chromosome partitioning or flagellar assembly
MLTDKDLTDIADRCNKATSGPWKSFIEGRDHESGSDFIQTPDGDIELIGGTREDQDFIANSRADIPNLIEEIKRLKAK